MSRAAEVIADFAEHQAPSDEQLTSAADPVFQALDRAETQNR
jgi:hypothetical protein